METIGLDLLFRIDFLALTSYEDLDDLKFEEEKNDLKKTFGFGHYFQRKTSGYEYIQLSEVEKNTSAYIEYLKTLESKNMLDCCQLEQAIGVFEKGCLRAFLSTDSGLCYNSSAHFSSLEEMLEMGTSDTGSLNSFYGEITGDTIHLLYSPDSSNIDICRKDNTSFIVSKNDFELKLIALKKRTNAFFQQLKQKVKSETAGKLDAAFMEEVFQTI